MEDLKKREREGKQDGEADMQTPTMKIQTPTMTSLEESRKFKPQKKWTHCQQHRRQSTGVRSGQSGEQRPLLPFLARAHQVVLKGEGHSLKYET